MNAAERGDDRLRRIAAPFFDWGIPTADAVAGLDIKTHLNPAVQKVAEDALAQVSQIAATKAAKVTAGSKLKAAAKG
mgnify:CR=1 FL=1